MPTYVWANVQVFNKISIVVAENCAIKQKMSIGIGFLQEKIK